MQNNIVQPQVVPQQCAYQQPVAQQPQVNYNTNPIQNNQHAVNNNTQTPPNYSGVNIQIFNPSVATPGAQAPTYNVNAPTYPQQPTPSSYGAGYYTQNYGTGMNGCGCGCCCNGNVNNGNNNTQGSSSSDETSKTTTENNKKTEKRNIVILTDEYIKNLENYLNSQDKEVRLMGAKEVVARLQEDDSRKDDRALNALVNKMLQDPSQQVKLLALAALDSRMASGDDYTVQVLKNMQNSTTGYGQDALQASNILLKMSGQTAEKEFEIKDTKTTETKTETKTTTK